MRDLKSFVAFTALGAGIGALGGGFIALDDCEPLLEAAGLANEHFDDAVDVIENSLPSGAASVASTIDAIDAVDPNFIGDEISEGVNESFDVIPGDPEKLTAVQLEPYMPNTVPELTPEIEAQLTPGQLQTYDAMRADPDLISKPTSIVTEAMLDMGREIGEHATEGAVIGTVGGAAVGAIRR